MQHCQKTIRELKELIEVKKYTIVKAALSIGIRTAQAKYYCKCYKITNGMFYGQGNRKIVGEEDVKKIIDMYVTDIQPVTAVSKALNHSPELIRRVLVENNISIRTRKKAPKYIISDRPPSAKNIEEAEESNYYVPSIKFPKSCGQADLLPKAGQCKFPLNSTLPYKFCQKKAVKGAKYCQKHMGDCYRKDQ